MGTLKSYVRNRSHPEGSIAEGYLAEEFLTFCSLYLADYVETKFNVKARNEHDVECSHIGLDVFMVLGHPLGKSMPTRFDQETLNQAQQYVLFNCDSVKPYIE